VEKIELEISSNSKIASKRVESNDSKSDDKPFSTIFLQFVQAIVVI
jgi:hypothetical protein